MLLGTILLVAISWAANIHYALAPSTAHNPHHPPEATLLMALIALCIALPLAVYALDSGLAALAGTLLLGGMASNGSIHLLAPSVSDYIHLHWGPLRHLSFDLPDLLFTAGILLGILYIALSPDHEEGGAQDEKGLAREAVRLR
jgi:lipoprotein signal peptidase